MRVAGWLGSLRGRCNSGVRTAALSCSRLRIVKRSKRAHARISGQIFMIPTRRKYHMMPFTKTDSIKSRLLRTLGFRQALSSLTKVWKDSKSKKKYISF